MRSFSDPNSSKLNLTFRIRKVHHLSLFPKAAQSQTPNMPGPTALESQLLQLYEYSQSSVYGKYGICSEIDRLSGRFAMPPTTCETESGRTIQEDGRRIHL
jgi:hypothetical protein